ncbi:glycosyltransferase [Thalassotalea nanhaiensis]|uniref:Glycosyltransferase n=1 Tax=Thalassotalea nanhaiensis TaxID=3065648 RepID=A0ABY9TL09_9GAMM|nr:glycosyltransferase [Colwelliaceae bacterium SQ345]
MAKTILMVAFDFPPSNAASVQRTLKFFQYLNEFGWTTIMLTAKQSAYVHLDNSPPIKLNDNQFIYRAKAFDVMRHLSIRGKHFNWMKTPDRWGTWIPFALYKGKKIILQHKPDIIWSTYPIPSAHYIASKLSDYGSIPWVADYRDPAPYIHTTNGKFLDGIHKKIDDLTISKARKVIFATSATKDKYEEQYSESEQFSVIENGYDEDNFRKAKALEKSHPNIFSDGKFSLYYAGALYQEGRDPIPIFEALSQLKAKNEIDSSNFELIFQGAGDGTVFEDTLKQLNVDDLVSFIKPTDFLLAIVNMTRADALLLIQDERFNLQVPGKIYEYLGSNKPILIKTPEGSSTAQVANLYKCCLLFSNQNIYELILNTSIQQGFNKMEPSHLTGNFSRKDRAKTLNELLNSIIQT